MTEPSAEETESRGERFRPEALLGDALLAVDKDKDMVPREDTIGNEDSAHADVDGSTDTGHPADTTGSIRTEDSKLIEDPICKDSGLSVL